MKTSFFYAVIMGTIFLTFLFHVNKFQREAKERRIEERRKRHPQRLIIDKDGNWINPNATPTPQPTFIVE